MSIFLTQGQIQQFDDMVKHAYTQQGGGLRRSIRAKTGVTGNQYKFPTMGKGMAMPRVPQTDVVPMNITHARKTATISDWNAPEYTDVFDQQKNNVDERPQLAHVIAGATQRREDQIIIDAWDAASTTLTVDTDIGGSDTNLNTTKFREAKKLLDRNGVPMSERYMVVHADSLFGLLGDTSATSADFNTIKALVDGQINTWLGFNISMMDNRDEGGLPLNTGVRTNYAYHGGARGCAGLAVGIDHRTEVNYIAEKTSWLANGLFAMGAVTIDPLGLVEVFCTE